MNELGDHSQSKTGWPAMGLLLLFVILFRGGILVAQRQNLRVDVDGYLAIAENLIRHRVFGPVQPEGAVGAPTAYRPPLYPLLLAAVSWGTHVTPPAILALHLVLAAATVLGTRLLGRMWRLGPASWLAALLVACDPVGVYWSTFPMTETLATLLAVLILLALTYYWQQPSGARAGLAGVLLGAGTLCRPTFSALAALVAVGLLLMRLPRKRRVQHVVVMLVAMTCMLAPWTARNWKVFGQPIFSTTHGGYTLLLGNNRFFFEHLRTAEWGTTWDAQQLHTDLLRHSGRHPSEVAADRAAYQRAFEEIRSDPQTFAYACAVRVLRLWTPLPHRVTADDESLARQAGRVAVALWYAAIYGLAVLSVLVLRGRLLQTPWVWGTSLCLSFTAVHAFYWSNMRMRAPLMPFVCLMAAAALPALFSTRKLVSQNNLER